MCIFHLYLMLMLFDYNHYFIFAMILGAEKLSYGDGESRLCLCWVKTVAGVESGHQHQPWSPPATRPS